MNEVEPIVVGTDFAARADRAIDRAIMLGSAMQRPVAMLHAVEAEPGEAERKALDARMRAVLPPHSAIPESALSLAYPVGVPAEAIARWAQEAGAPLVVLGVARHVSIGDYFIGTTVDQAIRHCVCPVLVIKQRPREAYRRLIVATDFSEASLRALRVAAAMFPALPIDVVHAYHMPFEGLQRAEYARTDARDAHALAMREFLSRADDLAARITERLVYGDVESAVGAAMDESGADLLVVGTHGESGLRRAAIGSQASGLLRVSRIDTMVVGPGG